MLGLTKGDANSMYFFYRVVVGTRNTITHSLCYNGERAFFKKRNRN